MTLPTSGAISLSDLQNEFGGPSPIPLTNYYRGGNYVPNTSINTKVPTSGSISIESFYGADVAVTVEITGTGSVSSTAGSNVFSLGITSSAPPTGYSWSTTAGTLSSTTSSAPTLTLSESTAGSTITATVSCTVSVGAHTYPTSSTCSYTNDTTVSYTTSISGGGTHSSGSSAGFDAVFQLTASTNVPNPSYSWTSTGGGSLSATTGNPVTLTLYVGPGTSTSSTVTVNVSGLATASTTCTALDTYCFSGNTRILTNHGYMRFDELDDEFTVINHTGVHRAKLIVHSNINTCLLRMGDCMVTDNHLFKVGENWIPARDLFHEKIDASNVTVYNCHVLTDDPNDHHYLLENGLTAHNLKA